MHKLPNSFFVHLGFKSGFSTVNEAIAVLEPLGQEVHSMSLKQATQLLATLQTSFPSDGAAFKHVPCVFYPESIIKASGQQTQSVAGRLYKPHQMVAKDLSRSMDQRLDTHGRQAADLIREQDSELEHLRVQPVRVFRQ